MPRRVATVFSRLKFSCVYELYAFLQRYYMKSARELQRVKSIQQSPIIHHYGESITGAATIRGFGQEQRFMDTNINLCDKYMRPSFYTLATTQWLVFRMELLSTFIFASLMMLVVLLPPSNLYSGMCQFISPIICVSNSLLNSVLQNCCLTISNKSTSLNPAFVFCVPDLSSGMNH
jgi:ABC-type multidrug transport system fused ATPase/permease subunit